MPLTNSSGATFPQSLSILLKQAKEQELTDKEKLLSQLPKDFLLPEKSLESRLKKVS